MRCTLRAEDCAVPVLRSTLPEPEARENILDVGKEGTVAPHPDTVALASDIQEAHSVHL